jgi:deoxycytidylate deaminase
VPKSSVDLTVSSHLTPHAHPELVFALIGPAGTDLRATFKHLKKALIDLGYRVPKHEIRLSKLIEEFLEESSGHLPEDERISALMEQGTRIREAAGHGGAVALLALAGIGRVRDTEFEGKSERNAYILHSLKHPEEVSTLRSVYGKGFFAISVYSPREARVDALAARITKSRHLDSRGARAKAEQLIEKDELEEGRSLGQDVKDAFPTADLFVDTTDHDLLQKNIHRFVELLFGHPYHTPTKDEYGMYHAKSAALRSSDLGRQVGASITTEDCDLIAVGCNDVPRAGGGLYWVGDKPDGRDFQLGGDSTNEQREQIIAELLSRFQQAGLLASNQDQIKTLVDSLLTGDKKNVLKGTQISSLLEFGRSVHAEMAALIDGARRGVAVKGACLYSTTFPCHLCAKHIIAAGIKRVVYIEPYPKSKARDLYSDSIVFAPTKPSSSKVSFEPFVGVAPRQYLDLFEMSGSESRKDASGKSIEWSKSVARPRVKRFITMNTYLLMEQKLVQELIPELGRKLGLTASLFNKPGAPNEKK